MDKTVGQGPQRRYTQHLNRQREVILRTALPYGLASEFWRDDDNDYRTQDFRAKYISALGELQQATPEPIADVYGPDAC